MLYLCVSFGYIVGLAVSETAVGMEVDNTRRLAAVGKKSIEVDIGVGGLPL